MKQKLTKGQKRLVSILVIMYVYIIIAFLSFVLRGNYENAFICVLTLITFSIPRFVEKKFKIDIPTLMEGIIFVFIFCAQILGELECYYIHFPYWDTMLHTVSGFLFAAVGFSLIDIINRDSRIKFHLSPLYVSIVAFCFSMTVGVFWEFFEFSADMLLKLDMQKDTIINSFSSVLFDTTNSNIAVPSGIIEETIINGRSVKGYIDIGLIDTMADLFVNFIGALVFSISGGFYIKHRGEKSSITKNLIVKIKDDGE